MPCSRSFQPLLFALALMWAPAAGAIGGTVAGVGGSPPTSFSGDISGIMIGSPGQPIPIQIIPGGDPWVKEITLGLPNGILTGTKIPFWEYVQIQPTAGAPTPTWTDWHEDLAQPGNLEWAGGDMVGTIDVGAGPIDGSIGGPLVNSSIWFDFPPVPASQLPVNVVIHKYLIWQGGNILVPISVRFNITQYPTVPEPATSALLGVALLGTLVGARRIFA